MNGERKTNDTLNCADQKTTNLDTNLQAQLSQLSTELSTFNAFYTCFCDTLAEVLVADQPLDAGTLEGIHRSGRWLKHRLAELQTELESIAGRS